MYLCDKGSILVLPIEYVKKIIKERMFIMNSKNKKIIKERMFTMNLKNKKIFSRIAAGVMTVAMAITAGNYENSECSRTCNKRFT